MTPRQLLIQKALEYYNGENAEAALQKAAINLDWKQPDQAAAIEYWADNADFSYRAGKALGTSLKKAYWLKKRGSEKNDRIPIADQEAWILAWLREHHGTDATDMDFHDAFKAHFGIDDPEVASPLAMRRLRSLWQRGKLQRNYITVSSANSATGYGYRVYGYYLQD